VFFYKHTRLYSHVCLRYCMHSLHTHTLHNSETLEPLTWTRVCLSHCCECSLMCSHVLYYHYLISVNIRHSNRLLMVSFCILTYQRFSPYLCFKCAYRQHGIWLLNVVVVRGLLICWHLYVNEGLCQTWFRSDT